MFSKMAQLLQKQACSDCTDSVSTLGLQDIERCLQLCPMTGRLLENVAYSSPHILEGGLPILVVIKHLKGFRCMLGIQKVVQVFWQYVAPAS